MGMYDYVRSEHDCPKCGAKLSGFQSKDGPCQLLTLDAREVDNYYTQCDACGEWCEFSTLATLRARVAELEAEVGRMGGLLVEGVPKMETLALAADADWVDAPEWCGRARAALDGMERERDACCDDYQKAAAAHEAALKLLGDLTCLAEAAMRGANNDGAEYDIEAELEEARAHLKEHGDG